MSSFEKGEYLSSENPYVKTTPRRWTKSEEAYLLELKSNNVPLKDICKILDRSIASVQVKIKRLQKKDGTYNQKHIAEKNKINQEFVNYLNPSSVLDLYSGEGQNQAYSNCKVVSNDINPNFNCTYNLDALRCLCLLYSEKQKFDLIDLDPFGSAYDCFDLAIKMAKKGLSITLGEMGHKRWKRLDFVQNRYDIHSLKDFTSDNLIQTIQKIGIQNKKKLTIFKKCDWQNISRVWFIIEPYKEVSQWEGGAIDKMQTTF